MAEKSFKQKVEELSKTYKSLDKGEFVKSGSVVLDALLGGGIPRGVFILWSAEPGCGKSTGSLHVSKIYCMQGMKVLYLDYEGGVNKSQIEGMGLSKFLYNPDSNPEGTFILYKVQTFKDAEVILDDIMTEVDLVVIDSATAMLTEKVKGSSSEDVLPGVDSRVMSTFLKKYKAEAVRNGVSWIIINQLRTKISFMGSTGDVEAGGNALKFYTDIRLMMKKAFKGTLEREEETATGKQKVPFGAICTVWAKKNRYERPEIPLNIAILFGVGIGNEYAYMDYLVNKKIVKQSGAWFSIKLNGRDEKVQGQSAVVEWISNNKEEVKQYIADNGGYRLLLNEPEKLESKDDYDNTSYDGIEESTNEDVISEFDEMTDIDNDRDGEDEYYE